MAAYARSSTPALADLEVDKITLEGRHVRLEPLDRDRHLAGLAEAIDDGRLWEIPVTSVPGPEDLPQFFADAETAFKQCRELAFATVDSTGGRVIGSTRFRMIEAAHRRVEIGFTFIAAGFQRTAVNTEAKLLMLGHAFDVWNVNRVEFLTDVLNTKSRNAIERIGARQEGILRSHMVMRDGRIRDSVIFSILREEWPAVEGQLTARLA